MADLNGIEVTGESQLKELQVLLRSTGQRCGDLVLCALLQINALTLYIANVHAHNLWAS